MGSAMNRTFMDFNGKLKKNLNDKNEEIKKTKEENIKL